MTYRLVVLVRNHKAEERQKAEERHKAGLARVRDGVGHQDPEVHDLAEESRGGEGDFREGAINGHLGYSYGTFRGSCGSTAHHGQYAGS